MTRMIQVRNVPERLHEELVRRARAAGQTLTDYLQDILEREVSRPPAREVFERIRRRERVDLDPSPAEILREERQRRAG